MIPLDEYENELLQSVENGEWISNGNVDARLKALQFYIKNQNKKSGFQTELGVTGLNYTGIVPTKYKKIAPTIIR